MDKANNLTNIDQRNIETFKRRKSERDMSKKKEPDHDRGQDLDRGYEL